MHKRICIFNHKGLEPKWRHLSCYYNLMSPFQMIVTTLTTLLSQTYTLACRHAQKRKPQTLKRTHTHTHTHTQTLTHTHANAYASAHAQTHMRACTSTNTNTQTHIPTHTQYVIHELNENTVNSLFKKMEILITINDYIR